MKPIDFQPFGLLYGGYPKPGNDGQPFIQKHNSNMANHQDNDKINIKLLTVISEESPSHLAIKLLIPAPSTASSELMVTIKLSKDNIDLKSYVIDSSHAEWARLMKSPPYILTQTPGYKVMKDPKNPQAVSTCDMDWVCDKIRILRLAWKNSHTIVAENLFIDHNLPPQASMRAIKALQDIFICSDGIMDIYVRNEKANFSARWASLKDRFRTETTLGNFFRRFYTAQIQHSTKMGYIDTGSAILPPASRPETKLGELIVSSDLMEITTRLGVASLQMSEYENTLAKKLNATRPHLKLLRILGAGDTIYSGFLHFPDPPEKRLCAGDRLKISFRPGDEIKEEYWSATVSPGHPCARTGDVTLDVFRPHAPQSPNATQYERSRRQYVDLDVSEHTASPKFETMAEVLDALTCCAPVAVSVRMDLSTTTTSRVINGLRNMQHGGKQENRPDGTQPWVQSPAITALGQHVLLRDSRATTHNDFLGDKARECLSDLNAEDHTSVIKYLSSVPTDKHGVAVGIIEGYPGTGKTFFLSRLVKALLNTHDDTKYVIVAPSNAPVDVAAKAIYDTLIEDALSNGEVVVRAHSAHVEAEYVLQYATKLHRDEADKAIPSNGSLDLDAYVQDCLVGVQLSQAVNVRLSVGEGLLRDRRFILHKQSLGYWALSIAGLIRQRCKYTDIDKWAPLANLFNQYIEEGQSLHQESKIELKHQLKQLRLFTISKVRVVVGSPTNLCAPDIAGIIQPNMLIVDEAGRLNRAEYLMMLGHLAITKVLLVGDRKQLQSVVVGPEPLIGFMPDLEVSVLDWYEQVNWPSTALYVQRRSYKGLMNLASAFAYDNQIQDDPNSQSTKAHPVTPKVMEFMRTEFPTFNQDAIPSYFFEVESSNAIEDPITKSWFNLDTAAIAVHIVEQLVKNAGILGKDVAIITAYQANVNVCRYALKSLHDSNAGCRFDDVLVTTCDGIQGGQRPLVIFLPVVTGRQGFVNDQHRLTVSASRASDAFITIGNSHTLNQGKRHDYLRQLFDMARKSKQLVRVPIGHPYLQHAHVKALSSGHS